MKTAKRVLAVIVALVMIVGTCTVAASAAGSLQAQIDGGATKITLTKNTYETLTVNRDLEIDLNGYRLLGNYGDNAIKITAGNVKIYDGQVISRYENITSYSQNLDKIQEIGENSPSAIKISGGTLEVEGVRIVGGMIRVPRTTDYFVPSGSAIQSSNNATVTIKRSSLYGDYGVNNKVTNNTAGGTVTIEDAIILAYNMAVKGGKGTYAIADGSEEIDAADRLKNIKFSGGIAMEDYQEDLIDSVIDERVIIVTKKADSKPLITVTEGEDVATISNLETIDFTWDNTKGTDCSYILVPEALIYADGSSTTDFNAIDASKIDTDPTAPQAQIRYRVEFKISDEAMEYVQMLLAEGEDNPLDGVLGWAALKADAKWKELKENHKKTNGEDPIDSYQEIVNKIGDLIFLLDNDIEIGEGNNKIVIDPATIDGVPELRKLLVEIGGKVAWASPKRVASWEGETYPFTDNQMTVYGLEGSADDFNGTLDRVQALIDDVEEKTGGSFTNTDSWGDLAKWLVNVAYPELIGENNAPNSPDPDSIVNVLIAQLHALDSMINSDSAAQSDENTPSLSSLIASVPGMSTIVSTISTYLATADAAQKALCDAFGNVDVTSTIATVKAYGDDIVSYVNEAVDAIENWRDYIDPNAYVVDNTYVKTYATYGSTTSEKIAAPQKLTVYVKGAGVVSVSSAGTALGTADQTNTTGKPFGFYNTFTLTATAANGYEFLYWANVESGSNRILSTELSFTMNTNTSRDIQAVFNKTATPAVYFTNPTGAICGFGTIDTNGNVSMDDVEDPSVPGYIFTQWPGQSEDLLLAETVNANQNAYYAGNSAFADTNAFYGENGAILAIRPGCSSLIVTPKFARAEDLFEVTFWVNGVKDVAKGRFSDVATKTAPGCYWTVKDKPEQVVCVNPTFAYWIYDSGEFEAVAGEGPDAVAKIVKVVEGDEITFYCARSSKKSFNTTGMLFSARTNDPRLDSPAELKVNMSTAKFNTKDGMFSTTFPASNIGTRTIYARAYIEYSTGDPYYGPVYTYVGHYAG
jgi:hypothetical protein